MKINTYLMFNGNCEAAFKFYEKNLGAKPGMLMRYNDAPPSEGCSPDMANKVMHARITLGDATIMGSDAPKDRFHGQHGFSVNIGVDKPEEAERLFKALSENAEVHMPMAETFWALRFGMLVDQFGIPWMVNCEKQG